MPNSVHIETPDLISAGALRDQLLDFDSRLAPLAEGRWEVSAEVFSEGHQARLEVDRIFGLIRAWLAAREIESVPVRLGAKTYVMLQ